MSMQTNTLYFSAGESRLKSPSWPKSDRHTLTILPVVIVEASEILDEPYVAGRDIAVRDIVIWHEQMGMDIGEISKEYGLTPAEIDAALTYYRTHRAEIDEAIQAEEESERRWDELFAKSADALAARAAKTSVNYQAGQTYPLDPDTL